MTPELVQQLVTQDLKKYLVGGICKIKHKKAKDFLWCSVTDVTGTQKQSRVLTYISVSGAHEHLLRNLDLDLRFPENGLYNLDNTVILLERRPCRSPLKLISAETLKFSRLFSILGQPDQRKIFPDPKLLTRLDDCNSYNVVNLRDELDKLSPQYWVRRLSLKFAISIPLSSQFPELWYYGLPIGYVLEDTRIYVYNSLYLQEVKDDFRKMNFNIKIS